MAKKVCKKSAWRFDAENLDMYSRKYLETELSDMFPQLKGCRLELSYEDSLVGRVTMESNSDVKEALLEFLEESSLSFRTIFITECLKPTAEARDQDMLPPKKMKRVSLLIIMEHL